MHSTICYNIVFYITFLLNNCIVQIKMMLNKCSFVCFIWKERHDCGKLAGREFIDRMHTNDVRKSPRRR